MQVFHFTPLHNLNLFPQATHREVSPKGFNQQVALASLRHWHTSVVTQRPSAWPSLTPFCIVLGRHTSTGCTNTVLIGVWKLHYRFNGALVMIGGGKQALDTMSIRYCTVLCLNCAVIWFPTWHMPTHAQNVPMSHLCYGHYPLTSNRAGRLLGAGRHN